MLETQPQKAQVTWVSWEPYLVLRQESKRASQNLTIRLDQDVLDEDVLDQDVLDEVTERS
jgi:hypothetical protein